MLYRVLHPHPRATKLVDGFVYVAVPLLVAWQVLPHVRDAGSAVPLLVVGVGFLLPALAERASHALAHRTDDLAIIVGLSGLALHALLEGAAFAPGDGAVDDALALAVILHRIPVGLVIWWLIRPRFGQRAATLGVASVVFATLGGFGLGSEILGGAHGPGAEMYQMFVSGSLVHVVYHQGRHDHDHSAEHDATAGHDPSAEHPPG